MPEWPDEVSIADVTCLRETEKAILVEIEGEEIWVPQVCVSDNSEVWKPGDTGTLIVSAWIARAKGWEE